MIAPPTGGDFLALIAIVIAIAFVVLGRALEPLLKAVGLVVGLVGAVVALVAAALAACAVILGVLAGWAGWDGPSTASHVSGNPAALHFAILGLAAALGPVLLVCAGIAFLRKRRN